MVFPSRSRSVSDFPLNADSSGMVKAIVTKGKKIGTYVGRVAVRASGSFNIQSACGVVQGISYRHCQLLQRNDGYGYSQQPSIAIN